jgi:FXSXX-COOH protein
VENLLEADLNSPLIDLTTVPLAELRTLSTSALVEALERTYAAAEYNTGNELQEQIN